MDAVLGICRGTILLCEYTVLLSGILLTCRRRLGFLYDNESKAKTLQLMLMAMANRCLLGGKREVASRNTHGWMVIIVISQLIYLFLVEKAVGTEPASSRALTNNVFFSISFAGEYGRGSRTSYTCSTALA